MEWQEPKVDWKDSDLVSVDDLQRIEVNIAYLKELL